MLNRKTLELSIASGMATEQDLEGYDPSEILEVKTALPYLEKAAKVIGPASHDPSTKTVRMIFNTQVADRMGDLLMSNPKDAKGFGGEGWLLDRFELAGGPYLHGHDHDFTVGAASNLSVEKVAADGQKVWALVGDVRFFDSDSLPFSKADYLLTLEGLTASSVGYIPLVRTYIDDPEKRKALGLPEWGTVQSSMELLEISKVAVPANQWSAGNGKSVTEALDRFVESGKLERSLASDYVRIRSENPLERALRKVRGQVDFFGLDVNLECEKDNSCSCKSAAQPPSEGLPVASGDQGLHEKLDSILESLAAKDEDSEDKRVTSLVVQCLERLHAGGSSQGKTDPQLNEGGHLKAADESADAHDQEPTEDCSPALSKRLADNADDVVARILG